MSQQNSQPVQNNSANVQRLPPARALRGSRALMSTKGGKFFVLFEHISRVRLAIAAERRHVKA